MSGLSDRLGLIEGAERGLEKLRKQMAEWASGPVETLGETGRALDERFAEAVADDLDTPRALVVVSDLVSADIPPAEKFHLLQRWDSVLGLDLDREVADRSDLPRGAAALIEERERARGAKDWATADRLRNELAAMGITLIDTPTGPHWTFQRHH